MVSCGKSLYTPAIHACFLSQWLWLYMILTCPSAKMGIIKSKLPNMKTIKFFTNHSLRVYLAPNQPVSHSCTTEVSNEKPTLKGTIHGLTVQLSYIVSTVLNLSIPAPDSSCTSEILSITTEILGNEEHPVVSHTRWRDFLCHFLKHIVLICELRFNIG